MIIFTNVNKTYGVGDTEVHAIQNINLNIEQGEFIVLLGKSGSGKSTFLSLLGGLEQPSSGLISWDGINLADKSEDELALMRRDKIGIIFQHFHLMEAMSAVENVELPLLIAGVPQKERRDWCMNLLSLVKMENRASHYPNELSGGERQRVGIARSLANRATMIIADEPTGDLDSETGQEIIDLLYSLNQGTSSEEYLEHLGWQPTIIMVTHDVGMLRNGMRVLTLSDGQIISDDIFDGDYDRFDALGNPSAIINEFTTDEQAVK